MASPSGLARVPGGRVRADRLSWSFWRESPRSFAVGAWSRPRNGVRGGEGWEGRVGGSPSDLSPRRWSQEGSERSGAGRRAGFAQPPGRGWVCAGTPGVRGSSPLPPLPISGPPAVPAYYSAPVQSFLLVQVHGAPFPRPLPCPLL